MSNESTIQDATLTHFLAQVPGVLRVHLDHDTAGALHSLRIEVAPQRNVRDILSGVRAVLADQREPGQPEPAICLIAAPPTPAAPIRIQLRELIHTRNQPIVTVTLALHGRRVVGIGRGRGDSPTSLEYLAGDATVQAINRLITPTSQIRLEHVQRTQLGQLELCLVQLTMDVDQDEQTAIGVSRIRSDGAEAAARAVLDATNRYLARVMLMVPAPMAR